MGLWDAFFGGDKSSREVRHLRMTLEPLEGKEIVQGQASPLKLTVKAGSGATVHAAYLSFDLVNMREERRGMFERIVTQSRFVFRFNLERAIEPGADWTHLISFVPPVCREGTRHSKYVSITWEVLPQLRCGPGTNHSKEPPPYRLVGPKVELEVVSRK